MSDQFFSIRGSRRLTREEYDAHLALAIQLENVAVLLGDGASKCIGGQVMADIWAAIEADHADDTVWLTKENFIEDGIVPNVEALLDRIEVACHDDARRGDNLTRLLKVRHALRTAVIRAALLQQDLWLRPDRAIVHENCSHHVRFLARLIGNRQPGQTAP